MPAVRWVEAGVRVLRSVDGFGEEAVSDWVLSEGACAEGGVGVELSQVMFALYFHAKRTH